VVISQANKPIGYFFILSVELGCVPVTGLAHPEGFARKPQKFDTFSPKIRIFQSGLSIDSITYGDFQS
jgi:hypothetical protein